MVLPISLRSDGVVAKIMSWMDEHHLLTILPIIGILSSVCVFFWLAFRTMPDPVPISSSTQSGDYCYINVQFLSNWVLKVSDDAETNYFYLAADADNNNYIVSMFESQFDQFADIVEFSQGRNTTMIPDTQRFDGIVKNLPMETADALAEALGLTSDEFADIIGHSFVDSKEDPDTILVGTFAWVLGLSILILLLRGIAAFEGFTERRRQQKRQING